jgi:tetratricopeptide (TPR) repeat protein
MFGAFYLKLDCNSGNNIITGNGIGLWADYFSRFFLEYIDPEICHMNNISGNTINARATENSLISASSTNYWGGNPPPGLVADGTSNILWGNISSCNIGSPFNIGVIEENNSITMTPELKKVASSNAVSSDITEELKRAIVLAYSKKFKEAMDIYKSILSTTENNQYIYEALHGMLLIYRITQDKELLEYLKVYSRGETKNPFTKVVYANALIVSNYVEEALSEYSEVAKNNPKTIHEIVALIQQSYIYYFDKKDVKRANEILAEVEKIVEKDDIHVKQLRSIVARDRSTEGGSKEYFGKEEELQETEVKMAGYSLGNYPNPFNPTTIIQFNIPKDEFVKLTVYDITGRVVKELVNGHKTAGKHSVEFNASSYASGTYYYKLEAGEYKNIQKMMLVK